MPTGQYLHDKLRIARLPPAQWIAALEKLSPEVRAEVEPYLREQAALLRMRRAAKQEAVKHG